MYTYSERSKLHLATCHPDIRNVFNTVIKFRDCTIIEGHRPEARQNEMHRTGRSELKWPTGNHNTKPSNAVDVAPYFAGHDPVIDWNDRGKFTLFAGVVLGVAGRMGIKLRWGGDWSMSGVPDGWDFPHFEILEV